MPTGYTVDNVHFFRTRSELARHSSQRKPRKSARDNRWDPSTPGPQTLGTTPESLEPSTEASPSADSEAEKHRLLAFRLAGIGTAGDSGTPEFWDSTEFHVPTPRADVVGHRRRRHDKFRPANEVIFVSGESKHSAEPDSVAERAARVVDTGQIRRGLPRGSSGEAQTIFRVEWASETHEWEAQRKVGRREVRRRRRSTTSWATAEQLDAERRARWAGRLEASVVQKMEFPQENTDRKMRNAINRVFLGTLRRGFNTWVTVVTAEQARERRTASAKVLQRFARGISGRAEGQRRAHAMYRAALELARRQKLERKKERAERRAAKLEARKRKEGVTIDGERFFLTRAEMNAFYRRRERACKMAYEAMRLMAVGKLALAFSSWVDYVRNVLPPKHIDFAGLLHDGIDAEAARAAGGSDLNTLLRDRAEAEARTFRLRRAEQQAWVPWHPGVDFKLPGLPYIGVRQRRNGTLEILDVTRFNSFKKMQGGPTDACSWLIKGAYVKVLFGAYPTGVSCQESRLDAERITARSSACAALLVEGVDTFVCLMTDNELRREAAIHSKRLGYDAEVNSTCATIRSELITGVQSCKEAYEFAKQRVARGRQVGYGKQQQQALDRAEANRKQDYVKAKAFFDNFAENVQHVSFPMPSGGVALDGQALLRLCEELERRIRRGERLYIFSAQGNGRVGVLASLLLSRMYGMHPEEALERVQRYHDAQRRFSNVQPGEAVSCPQTAAQRRQVVELAQYTEPAFDSVVRRGGLRGVPSHRIEDFDEPVSWVVRQQRRKAGAPVALKAQVHLINEAETKETSTDNEGNVIGSAESPLALEAAQTSHRSTHSALEDGVPPPSVPRLNLIGISTSD